MRHFSFSTMLYAALIILIAACSKDPLDDNGNSTQGLKLECFHEKTLTLTDRNTSGVDYIIDCGFSITSGSLIIEPGTTIQFEDGASITIEQNATIKAVNKKKKPIRFTNNGLNSGVSILNKWSCVSSKIN